MENTPPQCYNETKKPSAYRVNKGYRFLLTCTDVLSKFAWVVPLKNKVGESLVNGFQSSWSSADPLKSYRLTKELNFSIAIFKACLKKITTISLPQTVNFIKGKCDRTFQSHLENSYV